MASTTNETTTTGSTTNETTTTTTTTTNNNNNNDEEFPKSIFPKEDTATFIANEKILKEKKPKYDSDEKELAALEKEADEAWKIAGASQKEADEVTKEKEEKDKEVEEVAKLKESLEKESENLGKSKEEKDAKAATDKRKAEAVQERYSKKAIKYSKTARAVVPVLVSSKSSLYNMADAANTGYKKIRKSRQQVVAENKRHLETIKDLQSKDRQVRDDGRTNSVQDQEHAEAEVGQTLDGDDAGGSGGLDGADQNEEAPSYVAHTLDGDDHDGTEGSGGPDNADQNAEEPSPSSSEEAKNVESSAPAPQTQRHTERYRRLGFGFVQNAEAPSPSSNEEAKDAESEEPDEQFLADLYKTLGCNFSNASSN